MKNYDPKKIEKKWQKEWAKSKIYKTKEPASAKTSARQGKYYILDMFPYPSGEGLHVGHPKGYIATDIMSRKKRMEGMNVLHPMGFDAFGLPAENYAIKTKTNPEIAVRKNVARYKKQLEILGFDYDWSREVNTTDPKFYKWTQWIFLKLLEKGLAYESYEPVNWCPVDKTVLANEDVEDGKCERCGSVVEKRPFRQWVLKITDYADRLLKDLDTKILSNGDHFEFLPNGEPHIIHMNTDVPGKVRDDKPFVPRQAICAFIEHWEGGKFIVLKWKKVSWMTPITGGVEKGQTVEEAARAEIMEETGFKNIELVRKSPYQYHSTFFHPPKDENRVGHFTSFYFKLKDGEQNKVAADEQAKHEVVWVDTEKVRDAMTAEGSKLGWDLAIHGKVVQRPKSLLDWPESIKEAQRNWIGRSEGAEIEFRITNYELRITVFTTRADTLFGATYIVLAPENKLIAELKDKISNWEEVEKYINEVKNKTEIERTDTKKEKTGIELKGIKAINPATEEEVPVWIADYVLASYGTGAVMAVPAHDERDFEFAKKYTLPIVCVVKPDLIFSFGGNSKENLTRAIEKKKKILSGEECYTGKGPLVNSKDFDDTPSEEAREKIIEKFGKKVVKYKLRDWVFSRQRYWGEPIPVLHAEDGSVIPIAEKDLPITLPKVKNYEPTGTGESPLANIKNWVDVIVKRKDGKKELLKRETNTMPQWAGSSWYYLRFMDPNNNKALVDKKDEKYWGQVDYYVGGAEHATRHLIYARFWHKFLYDIGVVSTKEPFKKLQSVGLIMAEDGRKMSKRYGNVINPDDIVATWGADTLRLYEMFMGPFADAIAWSTDNMIGVRRFLEKVWRIQFKVTNRKAQEKLASIEPRLETLLNKTIKKVGEDIENMSFNTAISAMMILVNQVDSQQSSVDRKAYEVLLKLLAPFAPHMTEEIWFSLGNKKSIHLEKWPKFDPKKVIETEARIAVQVNGKVRGVVVVPAEAVEDEVKSAAFANPEIKKWVEGKEIKKTIFIPGKVLNMLIVI